MSIILITENKTRDTAMQELDAIARVQHDNHIDPTVYKEIVGCIDNYFSRLDRLNKEGTSIELLQSFLINGKELKIRLKHPAPSGFIYQLSRFFRRG
ncbi:hypothetical protein K7H08_09525 [Halomonas sp. IOP_6]|uniref:hypothetical protein n=1 Tax=Halomonas sp. IOP_6 TaxID=2876583 RepID=UPI001E485930|nr:hypothetical protein [Halomonas sp. IOP_6]MCD6005070.1 hypothetical protein [Halomonas sp. IOP_6]